MITSLDFPRARYPKPKLTDDRPAMVNILGIDSEAYTDGSPFMFCLSNGDTLLPQDLPDAFFEPALVDTNFMVYNLKYDSGAILYSLPRRALYELWKEGKTRYEAYRYQYIPGKLLRIFRGRSRVSFWDISQFYKSSLDKAAKTYLGRGKMEMRTKNFTRAYVDQHFNLIRRYCIEDAKLTHELGVYLINKLDEFGIVASTLYSCASIAFKYFCTHSRVVTAYYNWLHHQDFLAYACDSYAGGKFEVTARGSFHGYEYDIVSAYPYEISNLIDISHARIFYSKVYQPKAVYGFIRACIDNSPGLCLPCGIKRKDGSVYYPAGVFYSTITKREYEYLLELGLKVEIHSAYWLFVETKRRLYKKSIDTLFGIKAKVKGKDRMLYNTTKIVMNSYYGKMAQCIEQPDNTVTIGAGWNPVYASVITANTRIAVSRIQNEMRDDCLAVHTDSVITRRPISKKYLKNCLGSFEFVTQGSGILIACGMYSIADAAAYKGLQPNKGDTWQQILKRARYRKKIPYLQLHVESWREAMAKNHPRNKINRFIRAPKIIDLNCDTKRIWPSRINAHRLLNDFENSLPKIEIYSEPPKYWNNPDRKICAENIDYEISDIVFY